ncbi:unnamed protein product [Urochloa humidicola]
MANKSRRLRRDASRATSIHDVPDELLELVLLRVPTTLCLFRAAATCKSWRRVVAGAGFLSRFRSLHGPCLLLGHYCVNAKDMDDGITRLKAEFIPSPSQPANNHLRQRLSLDFLLRPPPCKDRHRRVLTDSHGGLLGFVRDNWYAVVCDPWTRQYREVRFPWGQDNGNRDRTYHCIGAFLLDGEADHDGSNSNGSPMSSFMVLCVCLILDHLDDRVEAHACVFSARHDRWIPSSVCTDIGRVHWTGGFNLDLLDTYKRIVGRVGGYIFWFGHPGYVLALDENTGEFSTFRLPAPPDMDVYSRAHQLYHEQNVRVVSGGGSIGATLRVVCVVDGDLEVLLLNKVPHGTWECILERRVGLCQLANIDARQFHSWHLVDTDTTAAALVLGAFPTSSTEKLFSLDVETMKLQRLNKETTLMADRVFPYEISWLQKISAWLGCS